MTGNHTDKTFKLRSITIMPITTSAILVARKMTLELNKKRQAEAKRKKNQLKKKRLSRKATEKENGESRNLKPEAKILGVSAANTCNQYLE